MKKQLLILLVLLLTLSFVITTGCKKDESRPNYSLRFTNTSENPYLIEIDGTSSTINGNTFKNYSLVQGTYPWKVTQQSGYLLYPTVKEGTVTLNKDKEIIFP